jgi:Protein of unknown function (DUF1553)/Protein of unknown function (DUF1549)/Planctomycete cytochrome C
MRPAIKNAIKNAVKHTAQMTLRVIVLSVAAGMMLFWDPHSLAEDVDYLNDVKPLLKTKCFACHGVFKQEANLRLDSGAAILRGGDSGSAISSDAPDASLVLQRVAARDDTRMPPEGEHLTNRQIDVLREWIARGAVVPDGETSLNDPREHWSFQPLSKIPEDAKPSIDYWIDRKLNAKSISRNPPADRSTLIRRLYLDMLGLPPSPEQISEFNNQSDPDSYLRLVDTVLASPRYGERWAQHWLDVVRYADTHGFEVNTPRPNAWPYRNYVIDSFNSDKSYDQFIFEQIAGDTVGQDAATGFLVTAPVLLPGQIGADDVSKRLARQDALADMLSNSSSVLLGLSLGCARCHDHKFDPLTQRDYYSFQAFLAGVEYEDRPTTDPELDSRKTQAEKLQSQANALRASLRTYEPLASKRHTIMIDDEDADRVTTLKVKNGHGANPEGTQRGYRDDAGDKDRLPNVGRGRYTWWTNVPNEDVFTYDPKVSGNHRVFLSWGVHGSGVHTHDARYVLDLDGSLETKSDQTEIARIDQYYFAYQDQGVTEQTPLWSGFFDAGVHAFQPSSRIVLRGGETETGITADVIVLQSDESPTQSANPSAIVLKLRGPVDYALNVDRFEPIQAKYVRFVSLETVDSNRHEPCIDELEVFSPSNPSINIALANNGTKPTSSGNYSDPISHKLWHINDGLYGNSQSWISNEPGRGWVQLEFRDVVEIDTVVWGRDRQGKFRDRLATRYRIDVALEPEQWTTVATSDDRGPIGSPYEIATALVRNSSLEIPELRETTAQIESLEKQADVLRQPKMVFAGRFREPDATYILNRGDAEQPVELVAPALPEFLCGAKSVALPNDTREPDRRIALARAITSNENALTARVMVNRIWQHHFGIGLVETSNDFGLNGTPPSNPELLDWLAAELIRNDWSIKAIQRLILTSDTYQQSNAINAAGYKLDGDCRLLWRFPARRIEAEGVRDCMLHVAGQLNLSSGEQGFDFFKSRGGLDGFPPVSKFGPEGHRRMIYSHKVRMEPVPVFGAFDCPDAGQSIARRTLSTTAIQALNLFNSEFSVELSSAFADHVRRNSGDSSSDQIKQAFLLAFGREPTTDEITESQSLVTQHDLALLCRVLINSNEFLFLP